MHKLKSIVIFAMTLVVGNVLLAQCPIGDYSVQVVIETDNWGEEVYWELVPQGQMCGEAPVLLSGGNMDVGCDYIGGGASDGFVYNSNDVFISDMICLTSDSQVDLIHVDSWGDGGTNFRVIINGFSAAYLEGSGNGETWTIDVASNMLIDHDSPCDAAEILTDGTPILLSNVGATAEFFEIHPPTLGCNIPGGWCESGATNTVWAKFIADEDVVYKINACNSGTDFDSQIAAWVVDDCGNWDTYSLKGANDDAYCELGAYYASTCFISCVPIGSEVYIQIDGWYGAVGQVEVDVEVSYSNIEVAATVQNISCALETDFNPDGSISVYVNNGGLDWEANWTGPFGYTGSGMSITGLLPGTYNVSVASVCSGDVLNESFTIINPDQLELDVQVTTSCDIENAGDIDLTIYGGTGDVDVMWDGPDGETWLSEDIYSASPGFYYVQVVDANGCVENTDVEVEFLGIMPFDLGGDFEMCSGETEILYGPIGNYSYEWMDGSTGQFYILETDQGVSTTSVVGVTVTNFFGCEVTDAVVITIINCGLSISNVENRSDWNISPNPFSKSSVLHLDGVGENSKCIVRDGRGRIVKEFSISPLTYFEASDLKSGVYFVEIVDEKGISLWNSRAVIQ
ncbi:MAG: hypothetical protein COA49_01885 [Bacteroidetes bacterium]|nr:MAG: hypothetical protein COA49_01885 [Bacteroidota bacterium]